MAIYHGHYKAKDIATLIQLSSRTVEGLIASMIEKLGLNNRYEMFVCISNAHYYMRYLMFSSGSNASGYFRSLT